MKSLILYSFVIVPVHSLRLRLTIAYVFSVFTSVSVAVVSKFFRIFLAASVSAKFNHASDLTEYPVPTAISVPFTENVELSASVISTFFCVSALTSTSSLTSLLPKRCTVPV